MQSEPTEHVSAEDMLHVLNITTARVYDVLMTLLWNTNEEDAAEIQKLHEQGLFAGPPPHVEANPWNSENAPVSPQENQTADDPS